MKQKPVSHVPVLYEEVLKVLAPKAGGVFVDCTLGLGGHSSGILRWISPGGRLVSLDFDPANIEKARARLESVVVEGERARFDLVHSNFAALDKVLADLGISEVDGVLADIGVASTQIDDPARGFSYRQAGPLDMRMDPTRGTPASVLVNKMGERELAAAFLEYGDETDAEAIARLIVARRRIKPIETTQDLMALVCEARNFTVERGAGAKLHPAARTFQALRILVNREIANLERLLQVGPTVLKSGGVLAIISFHSGEDWRVKDAFKEGARGGVYSEVVREPIVASEAEAKQNSRARSAKLRWARKA